MADDRSSVPARWFPFERAIMLDGFLTCKWSVPHLADQQGHGVDVNLNPYTQTSLANRLEAVEEIAAAFVN